jgi:nicotinamide mononucleotide (NMN) deamidase PncC
MAQGVRKALRADVGLATIGVAGLEPIESLPSGTVFLGLAIGEEVASERVQLPGDRNRIRQYAVISVLNLLRRHMS